MNDALLISNIGIGLPKYLSASFCLSKEAAIRRCSSK